MTLDLDPRRITIANIAIFIAIVLLAIVVMIPRPEIPVVKSVDEIVKASSGQGGDVPAPRGDAYPSFGKRNMFETLIPLPTPTPTPVPTPEPDPSLEEAVADWKVGGVLRTSATFTNRETKEEFVMTLNGDPRIAKVGGRNIRVTLIATDRRKATVTLAYDGPQGRQTVTKSAWDE